MKKSKKNEVRRELDMGTIAALLRGETVIFAPSPKSGEPTVKLVLEDPPEYLEDAQAEIERWWAL